jgi:hypothetical protein
VRQAVAGHAIAHRRLPHGCRPAQDGTLAGRPAEPDNPPALWIRSIMLGRLFKFFVSACVLLALVRLLFSPGQRPSLREWIVTLAQALLISAGLFVALYWLGIH